MGDLVVGEFRKIAEGVYLEGLSYDFKRDVVWYSDPLQGGVFGVTPDGISRGSFNLDRRWTGGVMMNADGSVLSTGPGGIMWNNPDTGESGWLLQEISGKPINGVNEMWPDGTGGIFFGTNDIEMIAAARDTRPTAVYRLTQDRDVITLDDELYFSNGLAYDALRQRFYCNDTFRTSWAWDVRDNLTLANKRVLLDRNDCDGMTLDVGGNVLITGFRSYGLVRRVTPDGAELPALLTPPGATTQIRFGGADLCDVYITMVPVGAGASVKDGKPLVDPSYLYRGRSDFPGVAVAPANFNLKQRS
ncbi:MAG: SMP-30/gluconolactonase/LRE family protein [Pseudomonadales bacterium]|nr:SMP-30/gluconolactonase/LRE family protein [Gammaproteobacteria bacterium]MBP6053959.1 SMP-30/gluconolactonase/LRE family protein [Pseudomonadales bacterium]